MAKPMTEAQLERRAAKIFHDHETQGLKGKGMNQAASQVWAKLGGINPNTAKWKARQYYISNRWRMVDFGSPELATITAHDDDIEAADQKLKLYIGERDRALAKFNKSSDETAAAILIEKERALLDYVLYKNAMLERRAANQVKEIGRLRATQKAITEHADQYPFDLAQDIEALLQDKSIRDLVGQLHFWKNDKLKFDHAPAVNPGHSESAIGILSDLHISEVVSPFDNSGFHAFNSRIASNRLWEIVQKFKQVLLMQSKMFTIDRFFLCILGDVISGTIHDDQIRTNDMTDQMAIVLAANLLIRAIDELIAIGIPITLVFACGNHPRTTKRMPHKGQAHTNQDWVIYQWIISHYQDSEVHKEGRIQWLDVYQPQQLVDIRGHRFVFSHGTNVEFKNSPDEYTKGIGAVIQRTTRLFDSPIYRKATGLQGTTFDQFVCGNTHTASSGFLHEVNGALTGQNELGVNWTLEPIPAGQTLFFVSNRHVKTSRYFLDVTDVQEPARGDNPMSDLTLGFLERNKKLIFL